MIEKKIPGGGTVKMVYDKRDRLRFSRNSEQSAAPEWSFIKYDALNRPVIAESSPTHLTLHPLSQPQMLTH